jgi:hypothetical protein
MRGQWVGGGPPIGLTGEVGKHELGVGAEEQDGEGRPGPDRLAEARQLAAPCQPDDADPEDHEGPRYDHRHEGEDEVAADIPRHGAERGPDFESGSNRSRDRQPGLGRRADDDDAQLQQGTKATQRDFATFRCTIPGPATR